ncbi:MAG: CBS domain-containing protein [Nannocystis sp.]|nr:CBS domain-containing protein [Nannocystis sp.]MBA3548856.1 CBS domain-containing protein [Nannocystis sp.]
MSSSTTIPMPAATDFMTASVVTVAPESDIVEAVEVLTRRRCSGAPVVDGQGRVVGVLTQECCMRAISGSIFNAEMPGKVDDHMVSDFVTVGPEADLFRVVSTFREQDRRLLVVDDHRVVGIITRGDALRALAALRKVRDARTNDVDIESVAVGWSALTQR